MNGKFEDKLAQLAFGELSPSEAAHVEAQAARDPEALRTLAMYRSMKGGFSGMRDVPEDQLSKERLRDAILAQGLRPQPVEKANPWGWLWMPATAFVLAAAAMVLMNGQQGSSGPNIVMDTDRINTPSATIESPSIFEKDPAPVAAKKPERKTLVVANDASPRERVRRARTEEPRQELAAIELQDFPSVVPSDLVVSIEKETKLPTVSISQGDTTPMATETPIVIIEDNRDESTGAYRATEVGTATNVLIGG